MPERTTQFGSRIVLTQNDVGLMLQIHGELATLNDEDRAWLREQLEDPTPKVGEPIEFLVYPTIDEGNLQYLGVAQWHCGVIVENNDVYWRVRLPDSRLVVNVWKANKSAWRRPKI